MTEQAKRYGSSLYELAAEESLTDVILQELTVAASCCRQEPSYLRLLQTPSIPKRERCALLDKAFEGMHPYTVNFLKALCEADLIGELSGCLDAYRQQYNEAHGILEATVTSAIPLSEPEREKLLAALQAKTGKTIELTEKIDPEVLAGLRLDLAGERLDGTVRRRLELLRDDIADVVL